MRNFFEAVPFSPRIRESLITLKTKVEAQGVSKRAAQELSTLKLTFGIQTVAEKFSLRPDVGEIIENRIEWQLAKKDQAAQSDQKVAAIVNGEYGIKDSLLLKKAGFLAMNSDQSVIFHTYLDGYINRLVNSLYNKYAYLKNVDDPDVLGGTINECFTIARKYQAFEEQFWKFEADTADNQKGSNKRGLPSAFMRLSLAGLVAGSSLVQDLPQRLPSNNANELKPTLATPKTHTLDTQEDAFTQTVKEQYWGSFWKVRDGETIIKIAEKSYPDYSKDPLFYIDLIRNANSTKNDLIFTGETLYIPNADPNAPPAYGFAAGEEIIFQGKSLPTKIQTIDTKRMVLGVRYDGRYFERPLRQGEVFITDYLFEVAAVLPAILNQPARVILQVRNIP